MKERLFKNWITTVLGIIFLGAGGYFLWAGKISFSEFKEWVVIIPTVITGVLLIRAKDSLIGKKDDSPSE